MPDYPSLDKTWQYNVNQALAAPGTATGANRQLVKAIKDSLIGFGSNPWQVRGSSNSASAALLALGAAGPGSDLWAAVTDLVWAATTGAHSWIVLRQAGIGSRCELMISCNTASDSQLIVTFSPGVGFSGGSITANPTASDSITLLGGAAFGSDNTNRAFKLHVMQSTDGKCTRVLVMYGNVVTGHLIVEVPKNPVTGWTNPVIAHFIGTNSGTNQLTLSALWTSAASQGIGISLMSLFWTGEGISPLTNTLLAPNDLNAEYMMLPIGLFSSTASNRGKHGMLFDCWWGMNSNAVGSQYAGAGAHAFTQFGAVIYPWDGSVALTS